MKKILKLGTVTLSACVLFGSAIAIADCQEPVTVQAAKKKYSAINKEIKQYLKENQQSEQQGNAEFSGYNTISSIKYKGGSDVRIYVNGDFLNLSISQRDELMNKLQGTVNTVLLDHDKITNDDYRKGTFLSIYLGKNAIGHSNVSNCKTYKWFK